MQYFDLVFDEGRKLNELLDNSFSEAGIIFKSANMEEIVYASNHTTFIFGYYPERYEYGKMMVLKDVLLQMEHDASRQYSVNQLHSFFQNGCKFYEDSFNFKSRNEFIASLQKVLDQMKLTINKDWEKQFVQYRASILPKW